jgi:hypothetical protein
MKLFPEVKISWPSITEEEIQDRSKGDYLSKGIVLIQTTWFVVHCIVRGVYRLEITELEVVTLAFVALTGAISYLWWDKPVDVRCSVPVYLIQHSNKVRVNSDSYSYINEAARIRQQPLINPDSSKPNPPERTSTEMPEPKFTRIQQFSVFIQRQRQQYGSFLGLIYVFLIYPFYRFFKPLLDMLTYSSLRNSSHLRVPTFHAFLDARYAIIVAPPLAVIFGAIHCIAWSFHFPTVQEQLVWRLSAASVSAGPVLIFALAWLFNIFGRQFGKSTTFRKNLGIVGMFVVFALVVALVVIYAAARIALLVLPFTALRALPPAAFVDIRWTSFLPHLG